MFKGKVIIISMPISNVELHILLYLKVVFRVRPRQLYSLTDPSTRQNYV